MNLIQKYKRLSFWNKLAVWGAIASIVGLVGLPIAILSIFNGPSEENIQAALKKALQYHDSELRMKYGENYSVAAITPNGFVVPKGEIPFGINVKWETGRVINMSSERVEIVIPDIIVNTVHQKDVNISMNKTYLIKKIGEIAKFAKLKDVSIAIEVIGIDRDIVIVGLGMAPN